MMLERRRRIGIEEGRHVVVDFATGLGAHAWRLNDHALKSRRKSRSASRNV
jgi:hypothetical protein